MPEIGTGLLRDSFTEPWVPFSEPPFCPTRRAVRRLAAGASGRSSSLSARLLNRQSVENWHISMYSRGRVMMEGVSTVVEFVVIAIISKLFKVDLVSEHGTNTTEALHELVTFTGTV